jgi:hypothetical protein
MAPGRMTAVLEALKSQLEADGWLGRPSRDLGTDLVYLHDFDGKRYWAELDAGRRQVWLGLSAGGPPLADNRCRGLMSSDPPPGADRMTAACPCASPRPS